MGFTYATAADLQAYASDWLARREEEEQELKVELGKEKQEEEPE